MMSQDNALGLQFDPAVLASYTMPQSAELALDEFHESWKIFNGFPRRRPIDKTSSIANSVLIRCTEDSSWRPQNLAFSDGSLATDYQIVSVVKAPEPAGGTAASGATGD